MEFSASRAVVPELIVQVSAGSTNGELVDRARAEELESFTTLVTTDQTEGRGRAGRSWVTPPGVALAASVYIAPRDAAGVPLSFDAFGWLPIAAGVAMAETVAAVLPGASVGFKWPNDVLVDELKVCGVLAELVAERSAVVLGAGVNLETTAEQLPVSTATSLALAGAMVEDRQPDAILAAYLRRLRELVDAFARAGGDATASGLREHARAACLTLGRDIRVELPGRGIVEGTARDLDADGRLVVELHEKVGEVLTVSAGDVTHVRHA
ncbi:MAG TPA: biotin--[acetyl-CoA-carboxylase] ligase [Pseudolysinimonas sp.]|nr:biotin--[acetyl-CoA-carboxylase] ligase [Pseudolysinimonas sp.]